MKKTLVFSLFLTVMLSPCPSLLLVLSDKKSTEEKNNYCSCEIRESNIEGKREIKQYKLILEKAANLVVPVIFATSCQLEIP